MLASALVLALSSALELDLMLALKLELTSVLVFALADKVSELLLALVMVESELVLAQARVSVTLVLVGLKSGLASLQGWVEGLATPGWTCQRSGSGACQRVQRLQQVSFSGGHRPRIPGLWLDVSANPSALADL